MKTKDPVLRELEKSTIWNEWIKTALYEITNEGENIIKLKKREQAIHSYIHRSKYAKNNPYLIVEERMPTKKYGYVLLLTANGKYCISVSCDGKYYSHEEGMPDGNGWNPIWKKNINPLKIWVKSMYEACVENKPRHGFPLNSLTDKQIEKL